MWSAIAGWSHGLSHDDVQDMVSGAAALIALAALVVAILARRDARSSAKSAETMATIAEEDADQRARDRYEAAGPQFERRVGQFDRSNGTAQMALDIVGGPGRISLTLSLVEAPWSKFVMLGSGLTDRIGAHDCEPGDPLTLDLIIERGPRLAGDTLTIPLQVIACSHEDPPRKWTRRVSVTLEPAAEVLW